MADSKLSALTDTGHLDTGSARIYAAQFGRSVGHSFSRLMQRSLGYDTGRQLSPSNGGTGLDNSTANGFLNFDTGKPNIRPITALMKQLLDDTGQTQARATLGVTGMSSAIYDPEGYASNVFEGHVVGDQTALAALDTGVRSWAYLGYPGREGLFKFDTGNNAANVTKDPSKGIYVAKAADTTGAGGAWVRVIDSPVNVKWFGAKGDGVTDDSAAIQAAIDFFATGRTASIWIPRGVYIVNSAALTITRNDGLAMRLYGEGIGSTVLSLTDTGRDAILTLSGQRHVIEDMSLRSNVFRDKSSGAGTLNLEGAVNYRISRVEVNGGATPIHIRDSSTAGCSDNVLENVIAFNPTGIYCIRVAAPNGNTVGANIFRKTIVNQSYVGTAAGAVARGTWAATTAYSVDDVVEVTGPAGGAYYLQCTVAGTSGSVQPSPAWFNTNITDGTVTWRLLLRKNAFGFTIGGGTRRILVYDMDATGPYHTGYRIEEAGGNFPPEYCALLNCNSDSPIAQGINLDTGFCTRIIGFKQISASFGAKRGIVNGGTRTIIQNATIQSVDTGILLASDSNRTLLVGNQVGANTRQLTQNGDTGLTIAVANSWQFTAQNGL